MNYQTATELAQIGNHSDLQTGAVSAPIYLSTTFSHPALGQSTGYDYTRTKNPTRTILEEALANLEAGSQAIVTSSGMSAIQLVFNYFPAQSEFLVSRDLCGGSYRYFQELERQNASVFHYFEDFDSLKSQINEEITAIFLETPTNPLMQEVSITEAAKLAHQYRALLIVDNTFSTPLRQQPLKEGADIVVHSGTKFLSGHNDLLAGVVVTKESEVGERLAWLSNTTGPTLSSFDSWLFIRSLKTLKVRFEQQERNAQKIAAALENISSIEKVLYPGIGAMISFCVRDAAKIPEFLNRLNLITFAESLGGVETLITYPTTQTHGDIPKELRESYGLTDHLLRLSIGIEDSQDLLEDLICGFQVFDE